MTVNKYMMLLKQTNPSLLQGRCEIRASERQEYDLYIRQPQHFYTKEERERRFGMVRSREQVEMCFGPDALDMYPWLRIVVSEKVTPVSFFFGDRETYIGEVWDPYKNSVSLEEHLKSIDWEVPALVKNFLVILHSFPLAHYEKLSILVRGSKASYRGGQWEYQLVRFLLRYIKRLDVHLYDINEQPELRTYNLYGNSAKVVHIRDLYHGNGEVEDKYRCGLKDDIYDVFVDDAYLGLAGISDVKPITRFWSLKKQNGEYERFLHTREGREFSSSSQKGITSPCSCMLCKSVAEVCLDAQDFVTLRDCVVELGSKPCVHPTYVKTLDTRDTLEQLNAGYAPATTEKERRAVVDIRNIRHATMINEKYVPTPYGEGDPLSVQLVTIHTPMSTSEVKGWWRGLRVHFVGVDPTVIAGESYVRHHFKGSFCSDIDVVIFCLSLENMSAVYADVVWCKDDVPAYKLTGREHRGFKEQVKIRKVHAAPLVVRARDMPPKSAGEIIRPPSSSWQRYCEDGSTPIVQCSCEIRNTIPHPCPEHLLVRIKEVASGPARKKISGTGVLKWADGFFYDGTKWFKLEGASSSLSSAIFRSRVRWKT